MTLFQLFFLFFGMLSIWFGILFSFKKKEDRTANFLLGLYLISIGYILIYNSLYWSNYLGNVNYSGIIFSNNVIWFFLGPIYYFYIKRIVTRKRFKWLDILHVVLPALIFLKFSRFYVLSSLDKLSVLKNGLLSNYVYFPESHSHYWLLIGSLLFYFYVSRKIYKPILKSLNKKIWLNFLSYTFLGHVLVFITYYLLYSFELIEYKYDYMLGFFEVCFVSAFSYLGFMQPEVFNGLKIKTVVPFIKYRSSGLSENYSQELKERLSELMVREKPYLDSNLRLDHLAEKLNLSRHHTSQLINEHFDSSFFDFINKYRIEDAKFELINSEELNVKEILYKTGFNNRVSFYKAFKKQIGITPIEFRKKFKEHPNRSQII